MRNKPFHYSEKATILLSQNWVDTTDIKNTLTYGDVDFDQSDTKSTKGRLYVIERKKKNNQPIVLKVMNYSEKAVLEDIIKQKKE